MKYIEKTVETNERIIAYYVGGKMDSSECIFLLNGFAGLGPQHWINQFRYSYFCQHFKVISMDYLGSGKSVEKIGYNFEQIDIINSIKAVLDAENSKLCHLVGLSYGGGVALNFSYYYKELVKSMVLISPAFRVSNIYRRVLFAAREMLKHGSSVEEVFYVLMPWPFSDAEYEVMGQLEKDQIAMFSKFNNREYLIQIIDIMMNQKMDFLNSIETPVQIVAGGLDKIVPIKNQVELNEKLINSKLTIFENNGHVIGLGDSNILNSIIKEHIDKVNAMNL